MKLIKHAEIRKYAELGLSVESFLIRENLVYLLGLLIKCCVVSVADLVIRPATSIMQLRFIFYITKDIIY